MYRKENGSRLYLGEGYAQSKIDKNGEDIALPVWVAEASLLLMLTKTASRNITADSIRVL